MSARSKARKRAVDLLYESDLRGTDAVTMLAERVALADPPVNDYTIELVEGVHGSRRRIDAILGEFSEGWTVERMPDVDRAILRLSVYEVLWRADVPDAVAIDEAVELAKSLSTDESPRFVNGVLGRIVRDRPETDGRIDATSSEAGSNEASSVDVSSVDVSSSEASSVDVSPVDVSSTDDSSMDASDVFEASDAPTDGPVPELAEASANPLPEVESHAEPRA